MIYYKTVEAVIATGLACSLTTGCSLVEDYAPPVPTAPDHTLEQVKHNMDYASQLGKLTLHQQFSLKLASKERVDVYNFTNTPVDQRKFNAVVRVMRNQQQKPLITEVPIHPRDGNRTVDTKVRQFTVSVQERDFVLVPSDKVLPKTLTYDRISGIDNSEPSAATRKFDMATDHPVSQRISVIQQPINYNGGPTRFLGEYDNGLATEICQSLVDVYPQSSSATAVYEQMAQETVCNGLGDAIASAEYGDYRLYKALKSHGGGTVDFAGNDYWIEPVMLSRPAFTQLAHELKQ